jgi:phage regulator Rha-like protein
MTYRTAILTGWTGKEVQFAAEYIKQWDEIEAKREAEKAKKTLVGRYGNKSVIDAIVPDHLMPEADDKKKLDETMNDIAQEIVSDKQYTDESILDAMKLDDESIQKRAFDKLTKDMSPIGTMTLKSLLKAYAKMSDEERKKFFEDINK